MLRRTVDKQGQPLGIADNIPFGLDITNKADVEERIRRAQRAILNPSTNPSAFLSGADGEPDGRPELSFSKNCVCLELSGPDLTDLSFCDLPGTLLFPVPCPGHLKVGFVHLGLIVSVSGGGNESDIQLVRDLVESYISRPSCLILLTVTCESEFRQVSSASLPPLTPDIADFENQGAHHMAKQYDPDGERTIGSRYHASCDPSKLISHRRAHKTGSYTRRGRGPLATVY